MKNSQIVRRPDFAGGGITADERLRMGEVAQFWARNSLRTDRADPEEVGEAIRGLYAAADLKEPRIILVPSPIVMAFAGGFASAIWHRRKTGGQTSATDYATYDATYAATDYATRAATDDATRDATSAATYDAATDATYDATYAATSAATYDATYAATDDAAYAATTDATYDATYAATRAATYAATRAATRDATYATYDATYATYAATSAATYAATRAARGMYRLALQMGGSSKEALFLLGCANRWQSCYQGGNMWGWWDSYLTAARDILGLRLPEYAKYAAWERASKCGGFRWVHAEFCIVSDFPEILKVDDQNRPHCEDGPSHRWRDGWSLYHWHGVKVPGEWIEDKSSLTPSMALNLENMEQRRAACEILGWAKILKELSATVIDEDEDPMVGTLLEVTLPDIGKEKFLRVLCGTGREFAIPVPPDSKTALAANAWTFGIDPIDLQQLEVRT